MDNLQGYPIRSKNVSKMSKNVPKSHMSSDSEFEFLCCLMMPGLSRDIVSYMTFILESRVIHNESHS